jgi:hypothetical protein
MAIEMLPRPFHRLAREFADFQDLGTERSLLSCLGTVTRLRRACLVSLLTTMIRVFSLTEMPASVRLGPAE